uniref:Uncharacterized protein n=1 Tax=Anguilla anguilla TaxID=7936 RepID=A0A0E9UM99_ANGAN
MYFIAHFITLLSQ